MRFLFLFLFSICSLAQQTDKVDFISVKASVTPNEIDKSITGFVTFDFIVLKPTDTIKIDAQKMEFSSLLVNNQQARFTNTKTQLLVLNGFKLGTNTLSFNYFAQPKKALYFIGKDDNLQIWTQGQGKYTSNWLPSFDDVNEKLIFNISVNYKSDFEVISNGKLIKTNKKNNIKTWHYQMKQPMSSYLVMLAIGKYDKTILKSKSGIPIELYLKPSDKDKFETTYKHSKKIFDFLERKIGAKYPWEVYRQVPIFDFLYAGMENTSATIFAQDFVVDNVEFNDKNYINTNAHELAHQWFGNLITAKSGEHHWLQEGFATYFALLAEKDIYGEDYFYGELVKNYDEIKNQKRDTIPILNPKASSTTFYRKGAMALHVLSSDLGKTKFNLAIKNYLQKHSFKNVTTDDFLAEIKNVSNYDVDFFKKTYLETSKNDSLYINYLKQWKQYKYIQQIEAAAYNNEERNSVYKPILADLKIHPYIKSKIFYELSNYEFKDKQDLLDIALKDKRLAVQKELVHAISNYPDSYESKIFDLLKLPSYELKIQILNNVGRTEETKIKILNQLELASKSNDKLRIHWLHLAIAFKNYQPNKKQEFITELNNYTTADYDMYTRIDAFGNLYELDPENKVSLENLFLATKHHNWHLVSYARTFIEAFLSSSGQREAVVDFQKTTTLEIQEIIQYYLDKIKIGGRLN